MVLLVVKGTKFPDEFIVERKLTDALLGVAPAEGSEFTEDTGISRTICHIQNSRHQLRLMLLSVQELARDMQERPTSVAAASTATTVGPEAITAYAAYADEMFARLKDKTTSVSDDEFDAAIARVRTMTTELFPTYCTHDQGTEAAIQALYEQHDNPDLDEDTRLVVYHCRAIIDPQWKINELGKEDEAGLWFCGKLMEGTLARYCGRNERSKVTVKVAPQAGPAPSGEPRMSYEDQRALYQRIREKRETYKTLEESELRDRVVRQARGRVALGPGGGGGSTSDSLNTANLRPICPTKEERVVSLS